jgi:acyl-CoA thioesterase-1
MRRRECLLSFIVWALLVAGLVRTAEPAEKIRVACIGDSITFGEGITDRARNSYPKVLGDMLGDGYDVRNLGVTGATVLYSGDLAYRKQKEFQAATRFKPNVVVIELGTNDSKPQNWRYRDWFAGDLRSMIDHFAALPSKPKIWLCKPAPVVRDRSGINAKVVRSEIIPTIERIAKEKSLGVIDLYEPLSNKPELFPDGVHSNAAGARIIAETVKAAIAERR